MRIYQLELEMQNDELRESQLAVNASQRKYLNLFDFAPVGYVVCTLGGLIQDVNLTGASMVGFQRASLVGVPVSRLICEEYQDLFYLHRQNIVKTKNGGLCELRMVKQDGTLLYAQLSIQFDGASDCLLITVTDISHLKEALRISENRYRSMNEKLQAEQTRRAVLSKRLINLLEEERRRIAGDLHDQVGQNLTSLKMDLESIHPETLTGNTVLSFEKITGAVQKAGHVLHDIKTISRGLRPAILDTFGLEQSLSHLTGYGQVNAH